MLKLKEITIRNFLAFGNNPQVINLDRGTLSMVVGKNFDASEDGNESNGVGKTTVMNAICYALFDRPISNISKANLVNNINNKNMEVRLKFEVNGVDYEVSRYRKLNSKTGAKLLRDGEDITEASTKDVTATVVDIIGVGYDLFTRIVTFSGNMLSFFDLPLRSAGNKASQVGVIEELFDIYILSERSEILKQRISETKQQIEILKTKIETERQGLVRHEQQIETVKSQIAQFERQKETQIEVLTEKLNKLLSVDIGEQEKIYNRINELTQKKRRLETDLNGARRNITSLEGEIEKLQGELETLMTNKCPYCKQTYKNNKRKIKTVENSIAECRDGIEQLEKECAEIDKELAEGDVSEIDNLRKQLTVTNMTELLSLAQSQSAMEQELETFLSSDDSQLQKILDELIETRPVVTPDTTLDELNMLLTHQQFLLKLLTRKDSFIRKNLLTNGIAYLNANINEYTQALGLPHLVQFREDCTVQISRYGNTLDYGNLSSGQRARVDLSLSLAFRDAAQRKTKISLLMLDEVLYAMDNEGITRSISLLNHIAERDKTSIVLVTHKDIVKRLIDDKIILAMRDGFTVVEEG